MESNERTWFIWPAIKLLVIGIGHFGRYNEAWQKRYGFWAIFRESFIRNVFRSSIFPGRNYNILWRSFVEIIILYITKLSVRTKFYWFSHFNINHANAPYRSEMKRVVDDGCTQMTNSTNNGQSTTNKIV